MSDFAIEVLGISKRYQRGKSPARIQTLGDIANVLRRFGRSDRTVEHFWALDDVSFKLKQGEILGIIGENGAGKSTLLKILSRIVAPTEGKIIMRGRVGALLEVGTGFHDELTGRENVYLNGAILGLKHHEISAMFDEIVDFAGVEAFIDTAVKHYSSGMRLRLGFAVAAHLNPEILIIDEVLAVGDDQFRRRSLSKMNTIASEGRTVIFVSHAMQTIQQLCTRAICLKQGVLIADGTVNEVVEAYMKPELPQISAETGLLGVPRPSDVQAETPRITNVLMLDDAGQPIETVCFGDPLRFELRLHADVPIEDVDVIVRIETRDNIPVTTVRGSDYQHWYAVSPDAPLKVLCTIPNLYLEPAEYLVTLLLRDRRRTILDHLPSIKQFTVSAITHSQSHPPFAMIGVVATHSQWSANRQQG